MDSSLPPASRKRPNQEVVTPPARKEARLEQEEPPSEIDTGHTSIFHRKSQNTEATPRLGESDIPAEALPPTPLTPDEIQHKLEAHIAQYRSGASRVLLNSLSFNKASPMAIFFFLDLIDLINNEKLLPPYELPLILGSEVVEHCVEQYCLQEAPDLPALLDRLEHSAYKVSAGLRRKSWDIDKLLSNCCHLRQKLSGWDNKPMAERLLMEALAGNRKSDAYLKLLSRCSPLAAKYYIQLRMLQSTPLKELLIETGKNQLPVSELFDDDNPKAFFLSLVDAYKDNPELTYYLASQAEVIWFRDIAEPEQYLRFVEQYICSKIEMGETPAHVLAELTRHLTLPPDASCWSDFFLSTLKDASLSLDLSIPPEDLRKKYIALARPSLLEEIRLEFELRIRAGEPAVKEFAITLYERHGSLPIVASYLNKACSAPDGDIWTTEKVKVLLTIEPEILPVRSSPSGQAQVSKRAINDAECFLDFDEVKTFLSTTRPESWVKEGHSLIAGKGAICQQSCPPHTLLGVYEGKITKCYELTREQRKAYAKDTGLKLEELPENSAALWVDEPAPEFVTVPDHYIAWLPSTLLSQRYVQSTVPVDLQRGVSIGFDGSQGGNDFKFLNHSTTPNVELIGVFHPSVVDWTDHKGRVFLKPDVPLEGKVLLAVISSKAIDHTNPESRELAFCYTRNKSIDFSKVGTNILKQPDKVLTLSATPWRGAYLVEPEIPMDIGAELEIGQGSEISDTSSEEDSLEARNAKNLEIIQGLGGETSPYYRSDSDNPPPDLEEFATVQLREMKALFKTTKDHKIKDRIIAAYIWRKYREENFKKSGLGGITSKLKAEWKLPKSNPYFKYTKLVGLIDDYIRPHDMDRCQLLQLLPQDVFRVWAEESPQFLKEFIINHFATGKGMIDLKRYMNKSGLKAPTPDHKWTTKAIYAAAPGLREAFAETCAERIAELEERSVENDGMARKHLIDIAQCGNEQAARAFIRSLYLRGRMQIQVTKLLNEDLPYYLADGVKWVVRNVAGFMAWHVDLDMIEEYLEINKEMVIMLAVAGHSTAMAAYIRHEILVEGTTLPNLKISLNKREIDCPYGAAWGTGTIAMAIEELLPEEALFTTPLEDLFESISGTSEALNNSAELYELLVRAHLGEHNALDYYLAACINEGAKPTANSVLGRVRDHKFAPPAGSDRWNADLMRQKARQLHALGLISEKRLDMIEAPLT